MNTPFERACAPINIDLILFDTPNQIVSQLEVQSFSIPIRDYLFQYANIY